VDAPNLLLDQEEGEVDVHLEGQPDRHVRRRGCGREAERGGCERREIVLPSNIEF
jgi:hypothetical protein